jgi:20S proteasome alpha/beta subunit
MRYSTWEIVKALGAAVERDPSLGDEADVYGVEVSHMMSRAGGDTILLMMANGQRFVLTIEEKK